MTAADFIPGPILLVTGCMREWVDHEEAIYIGEQFIPCEWLAKDKLPYGVTIRRALRRTQPQTVQQRVDESLAQAQTAIDAARKVCVQNGRIGLRQLSAMLGGELEETKCQTARCYERGNIEVEEVR